MCFPKPKVVQMPAAENEDANKAAAAARIQAEDAKRREIEAKANTKREDITAAIDTKTSKGSGSGGKGRRSLYSSAGGGQGYLNRFG